MDNLRCMCGDPGCASCGLAQGTLEPEPDRCPECRRRVGAGHKLDCGQRANEWQRDRKVCEGVSLGPWKMVKGQGSVYDVYWAGYNAEDRESEQSICDNPFYYDARFIARARTRWPAALDRIEELERENEKLRVLRDRVKDQRDSPAWAGTLSGNVRAALAALPPEE